MANITNIEIITITIALCALFLTIWQGRATIQHNKLSSKPIITIGTHFYKKGIREIVIRNNGLGPAIITSLLVWLNDEIIVNISKKGDENFNDMTDFLEKAKLLGYGYTAYTPHIGQSLRAGEEITLFSIKKEKLDEDALNKMCQLNDKVKVKVKYQSIYNEKYTQIS
jgi:hypothetical protein